VRNIRSAAIVLLATAGLGTLSGCGGSEGGNPLAVESGAPTASSGNGPGSNSGQAPRVRNPLDPAPLISDPCGVLTSSQLNDLGLREGEVRPSNSSLVEDGCVYQLASGEYNEVTVSAFTANKNGLSDTYAARDRFSYFEPVEIAGYPAVFGAEADRRSDGRCTLLVGLNDQVSAIVITQIDDGPQHSDPCPVAETTGTALIEAMKSA
jgi:hypothetical protein